MTPEPSMAPVELQDVSVRYPARPGEPASDALQQVSLRLAAGRIIGVAGPPGAGKTTLLELCAGELKQHEGRVTWFGTMHRGQEARRRIGMLTSAVALPKRLSVREGLRVLAGLDGLDAVHADEQIASLATRIGVTDEQLDQRTDSLPPELLARVALMQGCLPRRDVLLCDETLGITDLETQIEARKLLHEHADRGAAVLVTASTPEELSGSADEIHVLHEGRIVRRFGPSALVANLLLRLDVRPLGADYLPALRARFPDVWIDGHIANVPWIADRFDAIAFRLTLPPVIARVSIVGVDAFDVSRAFACLVGREGAEGDLRGEGASVRLI